MSKENIIYRCGWCGLPTDKDGHPLEVNPNEYLEKHKNVKVEMIHGTCCPDGDGEQS